MDCQVPYPIRRGVASAWTAGATAWLARSAPDWSASALSLQSAAMQRCERRRWMGPRERRVGRADKQVGQRRPSADCAPPRRWAREVDHFIAPHGPLLRNCSPGRRRTLFLNGPPLARWLSVDSAPAADAGGPARPGARPVRCWARCRVAVSAGSAHAWAAPAHRRHGPWSGASWLGLCGPLARAASQSPAPVTRPTAALESRAGYRRQRMIRVGGSSAAVAGDAGLAHRYARMGSAPPAWTDPIRAVHADARSRGYATDASGGRGTRPGEVSTTRRLAPRRWASRPRSRPAPPCPRAQSEQAGGARLRQGCAAGVVPAAARARAWAIVGRPSAVTMPYRAGRATARRWPGHVRSLARLRDGVPGHGSTLAQDWSKGRMRPSDGRKVEDNRQHKTPETSADTAPLSNPEMSGWTSS